MSSDPDFSPMGPELSPGPRAELRPFDELPGVIIVPPPRRPYFLHAVLFLLTMLTTLIVGARLQQNFLTGQPMFINDDNFFPWREMLHHPAELLMGVPFSVSLLGILMAHEMGHFIYSLKNRVYATLPFFIPAPTPIGTFGAFIQIKSLFRSRAALFDIGIAGPIAGFMVAVPVAIVGLAISKPLAADSAALMDLGHPLIFKILYATIHPGLKLDQLLLHPVAIAAWVGMLATSLNLLPGGQLDGGHILYALKPSAHRRITRWAIVVLIPATFFLWSGWFIWVIGLWLTQRHPHVPIYPALPKSRVALAWFAVAMFALTLIPAPFAGSSLFEIVQGFVVGQ